MDSTIPSAFGTLFLSLASVFTAPSFANFVTLVSGWIRCSGRRTISRVIQVASGPARRKHHGTLYRFLSRAVWVTDTLGLALLELILPRVPGPLVHLIVDDTLCRKSGPHLFGAGMHHDPLRSTYGRGSSAGRQVFFAFGHNWVVLSIWVPLPWNPQRGLALPFLFRLYRSKKRCPRAEYRKRTLLAAELIDTACASIPEGTKVMIVADAEYACKTLLRSLPAGVKFVGPLNMKAACYAQPEGKSGKGRPRIRGHRLPSPRALADDPSVPWEQIAVTIYGREVNILVKQQKGLWYTVAGAQPVLMVLTRDPKGRIEDRAYFATDTAMTTSELLATFSKRWSLEVTFRDTKQHLGVEDPQNGWWRRRQGTRAPKKKAGPQAHRTRGAKAVEHTVPLVFVVYTLVSLWYLTNGNPKREVAQVMRLAPWYRHKRAPCFADMLRAARGEFWTARLSSHPAMKPLSDKIRELLPEWLLAS